MGLGQLTIDGERLTGSTRGARVHTQVHMLPAYSPSTDQPSTVHRLKKNENHNLELQHGLPKKMASYPKIQT